MNWEAFRGKRVFLTGGSGFIGKWLIKRFMEKNHELHLKAELDILIRRESDARFWCEIRDIYDFDAADFLVEYGECSNFELKKSYDYFIHAAVPRGDMREWTDMHFEAGVADMAHVLSQAKKAGVKRFLFLSSGLVETDIEFSDPRYMYYVTKLAQEHLCGFFSKEMPSQIARIYSVLGYGMDPHYAATQFIQKALTNRGLEVEADIDILRNYIYIEDLVDQLWAITAGAEPPKNGPFECCGDEPISLWALATGIADYFKIKLTFTNERQKSAEHYVLSKPTLPVQTDFKTAIAKTCEMYQRHHDQSLL